MMNKIIKEGGEIHAGDGGYSISTKEKYDEFMKVRNKALAQSRIKSLAEQAGISIRGHYDESGSTPAELGKFAELIVRECADTAKNCFVYWPLDGSLQRKGCANSIKHHFGVE